MLIDLTHYFQFCRELSDVTSYKPLTDDEIANGVGGYTRDRRLEEQAFRANRLAEGLKLLRANGDLDAGYGPDRVVLDDLAHYLGEDEP